jgi:hypothetical protein
LFTDSANIRDFAEMQSAFVDLARCEIGVGMIVGGLNGERLRFDDWKVEDLLEIAEGKPKLCLPKLVRRASLVCWDLESSFRFC